MALPPTLSNTARCGLATADNMAPSPAPSQAIPLHSGKHTASFHPVTPTLPGRDHDRLMSLELKDGTIFPGYNYGAPTSVSGELVFQTGMVGYPESLTDPSYRGQILVITFPLVGNYGVPSRQAMDELLADLPAHFEASEIHVAGLVTASYAGEDYSHHLANSSLGTWLREQNVPAMYGVDTRALTKRIREQGSMLGRLLLKKGDMANGMANGIHTGLTKAFEEARWREEYDQVDWKDPNLVNLVSQGRSLLGRHRLHIR